jgi:hypothetical protein
VSDLNSKYVNWQEEYEDWEDVCPFCHGEGEVEVETETEYYCWGDNDCPMLDRVVEPTDEGRCPECNGEVMENSYTETRWCNWCERTGHITPMWNTVWDLGYAGYGAVSEREQREVMESTSCAVMWNYEDQAWYLCLMGCGMNLTASLAKAMAILGFGWLPDTWAYKMARDMDFATYVAGEETMPQLKEMMVNTAQNMQREAGVIMDAVET